MAWSPLTVSPSDWERKFELFEQASARDPAERNDFLARACGDDVALRAEVEAMLAADGLKRGVFERSFDPLAPLAMEGLEDLAGREIGPYRLIERIGEGGMGVVYAAEQRQPLSRRVALKLIKPGLDTEELLARFDAERQALALMAHPNIATVYDGGITDSWRPYFVMELVEGPPLVEYCDSHRLGVRQRLELFAQVCRAVHHAHGRGVLHRDLKPSNVLIAEDEGEAVPKVIDFGIAKVLAGAGDEATLLTRYGYLVGTPEYMSPEQIEQRLDLDVRTDVYSLGVMLYVLLAGTLPFEAERIRRGGLPEIRKAVCDEEVPSLERRLDSLGAEQATVALARGTDSRSLRRQLSGELAWIVARAMARNREERYGGADELAADLQRHLTGEPVLAGPPTLLYRVRKLASRHRTAVVAAAMVLASLVAGLVATSIGLVEARRARHDAEEQAAVATAVNRFLNEDVLAGAAPQRPGDRERSIGEILERAAATVEERFQDQPVIEAAIQHTLGSTLGTIGRLAEGLPHLERAYALRSEHLGPQHRESLRSAGELAASYEANGRREEAEALLRENLERAERSLGPGDALTLSLLDFLGTLVSRRGDYAAAAEIERETLERRRRFLGEDHPMTAKAMSELGLILGSMGRYDEAIALHERAVTVMRRQEGGDHQRTAAMLANLGGAYSQAGDLDKAEPVLREAIELGETIRGPDHPRVLADVANLASVLYRRGDYEEALVLAERARDGLVAAHGPAHANSLSAGTLVAQILDAQGRSEEALRIYVDLLAMAREHLPPGHALTGNILRNQGRCLLHLDRLEPARTALEEAFAILDAALGSAHRLTQQAVEDNLEVAVRLGDATGGERWRRLLDPETP